MLRLGKDFGWTLVLAAGLLVPAQELPAQTAAATSPTMGPQVMAPNRIPPANDTAAKSATTPPSKAHAHPRKEKATPVAEVPQRPPTPPTLEQTPPTAPRITYQGGLLSIDAHNSTLSQVLRAVQLQTGESMEIPGSASSERVVTQLGPGQPKDVLNSLLNGSKFDYIILGVTGDPGAVQKVILTSRQNSGTSNVNVAQNNNQAQSQQPAGDEEAQPDEGVPVANEAEVNPPPEQQPSPPGGFHRPMMMPGGQPDPAQGASNIDQQPSGAKTPEQLMQELQQMQQQQQQYQQQLNPANQNPR
jgi:hypothetical protein